MPAPGARQQQETSKKAVKMTYFYETLVVSSSLDTFERFLAAIAKKCKEEDGEKNSIIAPTTLAFFADSS